MIEQEFYKASILRDAYSKQIMFNSNTENETVRKAFSRVPREIYIPRPWIIPSPFRKKARSHKDNACKDPTILYQDKVFLLSRETGANVGEPSLHFQLLDALDVKPGETITHIGCGSGYYTAILSCLTGDQGNVLGVDLDKNLTDFAKAAFSNQSNVTILEANGFSQPNYQTDKIYVNYATEEIPETWVSNLKIHGKLLVPIGIKSETSSRSNSKCAVFEITNTGGFPWAAKVVNISNFIHASAPILSRTSDKLEEAIQNVDRLLKVKHFYWLENNVAADAWYQGYNWSLI